jgi:hypothetical protein
MIDQDRNQVSHRLINTVALHDRVEQLPFLIRGNCRILPYAPQFNAPAQERGNLPQPANGPSRIQVRAKHYIGESPGVCAGNGSHGLIPVLSGTV